MPGENNLTTGISLPQWLSDLPETEHAKALTKFAFDLAAVCATQHGSLNALADICGVPAGTLRSYSNGVVKTPLPLIVKINEVIGAEVLPVGLARRNRPRS